MGNIEFSQINCLADHAAETTSRGDASPRQHSAHHQSGGWSGQGSSSVTETSSFEQRKEIYEKNKEIFDNHANEIEDINNRYTDYPVIAKHKLKQLGKCPVNERELWNEFQELQKMAVKIRSKEIAQVPYQATDWDEASEVRSKKLFGDYAEEKAEKRRKKELEPDSDSE